MATITSFEELEVWKLAREQAKEIHVLIKSDNLKGEYPLRDQLDRSSGSVMDNVAEGFERSSSKEFIRFLTIARGSNAEVRSQLYRLFDRNHLTETVLKEKIVFSELIGKKLYSLIQYLNKCGFQSKHA